MENRPCWQCHGVGHIQVNGPCPACGATGMSKSQPGTRCTLCRGTKHIQGQTTCTACGGLGYHRILPGAE